METNLKQILTKNISWMDFLDDLLRIKKRNKFKQILTKIFLGWISWMICFPKKKKEQRHVGVFIHFLGEHLIQVREMCNFAHN